MQDAEQRENDVPSWFTTLVSVLFLLYPGRLQPPGTTLSWWAYLRTFTREKLEAAFERAPTTSSLYVPSAQSIREIALSLPEARKEPATQAPVLAEPCELQPDNPFLKLAQSCEYESLELGLDPDRVTPKHIAARRMQELQAMLDKHGPQDMPSEQEPRRIRRGVAA